jgi:hypothetical protein
MEERKKRERIRNIQENPPLISLSGLLFVLDDQVLNLSLVTKLSR